MTLKRWATMQDIARAAGVSRTTVSLVLNNIPDTNIPDATRQRVLQAAQALDYIPNTQALNLARGRTMMIALILRRTIQQMLADTFLVEFILGATGCIENAGYHLLVHAEHDSSSAVTFAQLVRARRVDGLLISSPLADDPELQQMHSDGVPMVVHGAASSKNMISVDADNAQGAYTAVKHLLDSGHRRIGHISNAPFTYTAPLDRLEGYRRALAEEGVAYDEQLVMQGDFTDVSGYAPMQALLDLPEPPTAVFVGSDLVALGAIEAIHQRGLNIPEDIAVIGFDDIVFSKYLHPSLTSIRLPAYQLGQRAGSVMLAVLRGEQCDPLRILLPTELIVRGSTQKLNPVEKGAARA